MASTFRYLAGRFWRKWPGQPRIHWIANTFPVTYTNIQTDSRFTTFRAGFRKGIEISGLLSMLWRTSAWCAGCLKSSIPRTQISGCTMFSPSWIGTVREVSLVRGDFMESGNRFLAENPHLVVALLYLDFDLYEPTKKALELFLPRMPRGSILVFDEINNPAAVGETIAMLESVNLRDLSLQQYPYEPNTAYAVL